MIIIILQTFNFECYFQDEPASTHQTSKSKVKVWCIQLKVSVVSNVQGYGETINFNTNGNFIHLVYNVVEYLK